MVSGGLSIRLPYSRGDMSVTSEPMPLLSAFRERLYTCMNRRADALFELCDACLTEGAVPSPVHLSLAPVHRRGWGSLYAALRHGGMTENTLRDLLTDSPLAEDSRDSDRPPVYALDQSV